MIFVIGSQALRFYSRLAGREPMDWDLLTPATKSTKKIDKLLIDSIAANDPIDQTNWDLYDYCVKNKVHQMKTPIGLFWVAPIEVLKALKLGSIPMDKAKHRWDLDQLKDVELGSNLINIAMKRVIETNQKVESQKKLFFNKYEIPRFFQHDKLHRYIDENPAYLSILKEGSSVKPDKDKFNLLNLEEKKRVLWEECLVLALERELILQVRKAPYFVETLVIKFMNTDTSSSAALRWLSRLSIPGKLKDHPEWLAQWALDSHKDLFDGFRQWWNLKMECLPEEFWSELLAE
jgi:hypothetical protein